MARAGDAIGVKESAGRLRRWIGLLGIVGLATLGLAGCGGDTSTTDNRIMDIEMTFTPSPATAVASEQEGFTWVAPFQVTLRETGGLGGAIRNIQVNIYESLNGEPGDEADPERSVLEYPALRLDAGGTFEMTVNSYYSLPNEGKVALIDVFVYVTDDAGFNGQVGGRLVVQ